MAVGRVLIMGCLVVKRWDDVRLFFCARMGDSIVDVLKHPIDGMVEYRCYNNVIPSFAHQE